MPTHTHAHTKAHLCVAPGTLLYQAPRHGAAHGETLEEAANEVAEAKGHQLLWGKCGVRSLSLGISRMTDSQSPSPLNGLQCLTVVPNILLFLPSVISKSSPTLLCFSPIMWPCVHLHDPHHRPGYCPRGSHASGQKYSQARWRWRSQPQQWQRHFPRVWQTTLSWVAPGVSAWEEHL